jgi:transcriptional regulator with XRE-family HTH domain
MRTEPAFQLQTAAQFALYVRSLRKSQGLTQRQLGERIGVTAARISEIERNPGAVGLTQLLKLLHVLGARAYLELNDSSMRTETGTPTTRGEW